MDHIEDEEVEDVVEDVKEDVMEDVMEDEESDQNLDQINKPCLTKYKKMLVKSPAKIFNKILYNL